MDARTKQILWGKAGAVCSFPNCGKRLVRDASPVDREVLVGEIAHIVSQSAVGPRSKEPVPGGAKDGYGNLILLCHEHHEIIDQQAATYPVERILQFKRDHEEWVQRQLSKDEQYTELAKSDNLVTETIFSTLLPLTELPHYIYSGPCIALENEARTQITAPTDKRILTPFIIRGGQLYSFNDLTDISSLFGAIVDPYSAKRHNAPSWWDTPDKCRWYVELLNRTMNKVTGRLGLKLDKDHHRYFFEPDAPGKEKRIVYQSVGGVRAERSVAWNPHFKHNDEAKRFWEHLAVGLQFHRLGQDAWGLAIRPERRFTSDGFKSLESKTIGRKSTKRKSRMYNFDLLKEVQFWRDYLSQGKPRIIAPFGGQRLVVENNLLSTVVTWPEVGGDPADRMAAKYEEDLFTLADLHEGDDFDEFDDEVTELEPEPEPDPDPGLAEEQ